MRRRFFVHAAVSEPEFIAMSLIATREKVSVSEALRKLIRRELDRQEILIGRMVASEKAPVLQNG